MSEREAVRDRYDLDIQLGGGPAKGGTVAGVVVKHTYRIDPDGHRCLPAEPFPLENPFNDEESDAPVPPHSDFWGWKAYTDVGVVGSAFPQHGRPVDRMRVGLAIGDRKKFVDVFGDREVEWTPAGTPRIGAPEPFTQMPLEHARSYGGIDFRAPFDPDDPRAFGVTLEADHPGMYPRNRWGTGYLAHSDPIEGVRLPNLENPGDLLTEARLIADPERWYQQPVPWYLDWTPVNCFPRSLYFAIECDPWYEPPDDEQLAEVQYGMLPNGYRTALAEQTFGSAPDELFGQEASHGLMCAEPLYGVPLELHGMHPDRPLIKCTLPPGPPSVVMRIENETSQLETKLTSVVVYPDREAVTLVHAAFMQAPRPFIAGIHKYIPIAVSVDGDTPVEYQPPPTIKERLKAAQEESES